MGPPSFPSQVAASLDRRAPGSYAGQYAARKGLAAEFDRPRTAEILSFPTQKDSSWPYNTTVFRQKKPRPGYSADRAGKSSEVPDFNGRGRPVKGSGVPPADRKEQDPRGYLFTQHKRFCETSHLPQARPF